MAGLTGETVASTYNLLLKVRTTGIDASTQRYIDDGDGTASALKLSGAGMTSDGTLTVNGISTLTGAVAMGAAATVATTLGVTGVATLSDATDSSSSTTGGTIISGGCGIAKKLFVGTTLDVTGASALDGAVTMGAAATVATTLGVTGVLTASGGVTGDVTGDLTGEVTATGTLANGVTAHTQTAGDNSTKVATTAYADAVAPVGTITAYAAASAPTGWLLCNGDAVSRTTYSDLHALLKDVGGSDNYAYGNGNGSSTFNVPDLKGNVPVGKDASTFAAEGDTGGVEEVTLSGAESGTSAHGHTMYTQTDTHASSPFHVKGNPPTGGDNDTELSAVYSGDKGVVDAAAAAASSAHTNLQPYLVINYIIKT